MIARTVQDSFLRLESVPQHHQNIDDACTMARGAAVFAKRCIGTERERHELSVEATVCCTIGRGSFTKARTIQTRTFYAKNSSLKMCNRFIHNHTHDADKTFSNKKKLYCVWKSGKLRVGADVTSRFRCSRQLWQRLGDLPGCAQQDSAGGEPGAHSERRHIDLRETSDTW